MKELRNRISKVLEYTGLSAAAFAKVLNLKTNQAIYDLKSGKTKSLSQDMLFKITSCYPNISITWLLTGEGDMLQSQAEVEPLYKVESTDPDDVVLVRRFSLSPTATFTDFVRDVTAECDTIGIHPEPGEILTPEHCVFSVHGDSMLPQIQSADRILCVEVRPTRWHSVKGVVAIAYGSSFVLKRILKNRLDSDNLLTLASDNPDYPATVDVPLCDIRCIFRAVRLLSRPIH